VLSVDESRDAAIGLAPPTAASLSSEVADRWSAAGLTLQTIETLAPDRVRALPTSWAKRLGFGAPRTVWQLVARKHDGPVT
jgi:hypothetical protein